MSLLRKITWGKSALLLLLILLTGSDACHRSRPERVLMVTDLGEISLEIYARQAPVTTRNFLSLVEKGVYTHAFFYRTVHMENQPNNEVKIDVIQGGLFDDDLVNTYPTIAHETSAATGILHKDGVISMARNEPGSASTEFFICIGDQPSLDFGGDRNPDGQGFAAFGKVTGGMDLVRQIQSLPDSGQYLADRVMIHEMHWLR
jgi:peptidyl-prolyl cis-trans isomerase A (cyclophilin A)